MRVNPFTGSGSTYIRRDFWRKVARAVNTIQKKAGKNVVVEERRNKGTVISIPQDERGRGAGPHPTGACCTDGLCSITTRAGCESGGGNYLGDGTTCEGVDCTVGACCDADGNCSLTTEEGCSGTFFGYGTTCDDVDCTQGACCKEGSCTVETKDDCFASGGYYLGDGTTCASPPDPCPLPLCQCYYEAFDGSGRKFRRYTATVNGTVTRVSINQCAPTSLTQTWNISGNYEAHYASDASPPCDPIVDTNTRSSHYTDTDGGSCSHSDFGCFCSDTGAPMCGSPLPGAEQSCGGPTDGSTVTETARRTYIYDFSDSFSFPCGEEGNISCDTTGTYTVVEELSEECVTEAPPP